jgi:reactive intermediate/imine deaminase
VSEYINPPEIHAPRGYTHVIAAGGGRLVFVSGQVSVDAGGKIVGQGDMAAQAEQVFANLKSALAAAGADFTHVVKFGVFITDISQIAAVRAVRDRYIEAASPPASTAVEVSRLVLPEFLVEVDAIAVVPD